jgi:hypothetical protein
MDEATWREGDGRGVVRMLNHRNNRREPPGTVPLLFSKKGGDMAEWPEDLRVREFPGSTGNSPPRGGVAETHDGD